MVSQSLKTAKKVNCRSHEGASAVGRAQGLSDFLLVTSSESCYWLPLNGNIVMMVTVRQFQSACSELGSMQSS